MGELLDLSGGTIVVTGAGSGIGEGLARVAAALGMDVVLADVVAHRIEEIASELRDEGRSVLALPTDVRDFEAVERLADATFRAFGDVRVVVNNAGIEATGPTWEMSPQVWENVIRVNLLGAYHGVRAFVPRLLAQATRAAIVNLSSIAALSSGPPQQSAYNASKHGVQALSECLHLELLEVSAPISVHVVTPGPVGTRIFSDAVAEGAGAGDLKAFFHGFVTDHGLTGVQAAELILRGLQAGEFWIQTHPAMQDDAVRRRASMLLERTAPEPVGTESLIDL